MKHLTTLQLLLQLPLLLPLLLPLFSFYLSTPATKEFICSVLQGEEK
jgi:hypothetical protein